MKTDLEQKIANACQDLFGVKVFVELTRPEEQFGDYATNVALQLSKQLSKSPRDIGENLAEKLREVLQSDVNEISVAGPGFVNIKLSDASLIRAAQLSPSRAFEGQTVVAEYSDPNPFKLLHAGHVYTTIVGDAIANLLENAGGNIHRVNYGGDVGLHVGKTMWAILQRLDGENPDKLSQIPVDERATWLSTAYVEGNNSFETNETAKAEMVELNKRVYKLHAENDHESPLARIYWQCREWSYAAFDAFYERLGTKMEKYYPESEVADIGLAAVKDHIGSVFSESDGAVIFEGENYGLHTRVFINREGLPTYEAKEVGIILKKFDDYKFDKSIVITANEQEQYMAVTLKAIEQFLPELASKSLHLPHGMVRLAGGVKMSSRKGNIIPANEVLNVTEQALSAAGREAADSTVLGAVKYAFLKNRLGGDIIYDPAESVSLEGNSGPYLQYAHARACSILRKSDSDSQLAESVELETGERSLLRKITEYPEVIEKATAEYSPHILCTYIYELAQVFNRFYEHNRVINDPRQPIRLGLVEHYATILNNGLALLGIVAPDSL